LTICWPTWRRRWRQSEPAPERLKGEQIFANTCYSFVSDTEVVHVASVHKYDREKKTLVAVNGAGGLSPQANVLEGQYAKAWARNIWADTLL